VAASFKGYIKTALPHQMRGDCSRTLLFLSSALDSLDRSGVGLAGLVGNRARTSFGIVGLGLLLVACAVGSLADKELRSIRGQLVVLPEVPIHR
jgi:hypothetical protein